MAGFADDSGGRDVVFADNVDFSGSLNNQAQILSNGQLLIGSAIVPNIRPGFLTPGAGVTITNGPGTITIALSGGGSAVEHLTGNTGGQLNPDGSNNFNILGTGGITFAGVASTLTASIIQGGFTWTDVTTATQALSVQNGYLTDRGAGVTYTLPATASLGDVIKINGKLGITTIAQNANQTIRMSSALSTTGVGGSVVGTNVGECITLRCSTSGANTIWIAENFVGNWTVN
jgi:hypothetical protein